MNYSAVWHQPISKDAYINSNGYLTIRLSAARGDLESCVLFFGDRVCPRKPIEMTPISMELVASDLLRDYYEVEVVSDYTRICYYFELCDRKREKIYFCEYGFSKEIDFDRTQFFQYPYLHRDDALRFPEWSKNMVMYHIFPDSFASGRREISKQGKRIDLGNGLVSECRNGGTLQGIIQNMDYIRNLGITCIYLNPIFKAASYHKYDTIDYKQIDPCIGTIEELKELVRICHKSGIHVILDGVFNHCGSGFFAFQDLLKNGLDSKYRDWFYRVEYPVSFTDPPNYETYAYVKEMPKLDTSNPEVLQYFCEVGRYWIREADIDGWRLDVANEINHNFWREFRRAIHEEKEDTFLIGEIWEDSTVWLRGDQFDSTMNYSFCYNCREFFAKNTIQVSEFDAKMQHMFMRYPDMVMKAQMNFLDTHDVPRFLSYCNGDRRKLKLAAFYMFCTEGIPSVFYGDELGCQGVTEAEYRMPMPWNRIQSEEYQFYRSLIHLRNEHRALSEGIYRTILCDDSTGIYAFIRRNDEETLLVVINNSNKKERFQLPRNLQSKKWEALFLKTVEIGLLDAYSGNIYKLEA
ncbi:glycoside hydrolase family 13 protein [Lachnospiraceae bacterium YH-ros2228]